MAKVVDRVIVFVQENHTTDNYFLAMRAWGADVATGWPPQPNPPKHDQSHTRAAYAKWLHAQHDGTPTLAAHTQIDTDTVLPFYSYLAKTGAFLDNHCCGFGTNSTPNHLLIVGGQQTAPVGRRFASRPVAPPGRYDYRGIRDEFQSDGSGAAHIMAEWTCRLRVDRLRGGIACS